jgi:hypothetical protein
MASPSRGSAELTEAAPPVAAPVSAAWLTIAFLQCPHPWSPAPWPPFWHGAPTPGLHETAARAGGTGQPVALPL